jgi:hypothetical protein
VKGHINSSWRRLRPLPASSLVVFRRYLAALPRPLPAAPLVVRRRQLIVAPRPLPHCASQVLDRCARPMSAAPRKYLIVVPRLSAEPLVVRRRYLIIDCSQAVARGTARCASQVLDRCVVCRKCLIVVPRPLPAAPLIVRRRYVIVVSKQLSSAPRRCCSRKNTTRQMYSGAEYILAALSVQWQGSPRGDVPFATSARWPLLRGGAGACC